METFFFDEGDRLFGAYMPPGQIVGAESRTLFFYPWGQDYPRSHRTMTYLGRELAAEGHHVMFFDYFGTGDSLGKDLDLNFQSACEDAASAVEEFTEIAGDATLNFVGLRIGANVALACAKLHPPARLVLWDPIYEGSQYLATLTQLQTELCRDPYRFRTPRQTPPDELLGYRFSETSRAQLADLRLEDQVQSLSEKGVNISLIRPQHWPKTAFPEGSDPRLNHVKPAAYDHWDHLDRLELAINPGEETRHIKERLFQ